MTSSGAALTRRGWTLTGAASGLLLAGRLLGALELTILGVITLSLLLLAWLWVRSRKRVVRVERTVRPTRVHVGGDARVDLEVDDPGSADSPQLLLTDVFDGGRRAARFLVPALRRGQRARAAYRVPTNRRGRYSLGPITLTVTDPFGLARRSWTAGAADEVTICPRVHELRPPPGAPGRLRSASPFAVRFHAPAVDGEEFLTLRDYEVGDDLRRIHWRSTARTGELVVREDEAQWQPRHRAARHAPRRARRRVVRSRGRSHRIRRRPPRPQRAAGRGHHHRRPDPRCHGSRAPPRHRSRSARHGPARGRDARRPGQPRGGRPAVACRAAPWPAHRGHGRALAAAARHARVTRRPQRAAGARPDDRSDRGTHAILGGCRHRRRHARDVSPRPGTQRWSGGPAPAGRVARR